jgi:pentatricopeptide repeat protein
LHRLRRRRNGLPLAERRLEEAISYMLTHQQKNNVTSLIEESAQKFNREASEQILMFPDEVSFNSVISSHSKNANRDLMAPKRAEQLLRQMQSLSLTFPHLAPTIFTYNAVMEAYAKSASARNNRRSQNHQQTLVRLFREVKETLGLNTYTYDLMLMLKDPSLEEWQQAESWADAFLKGSSRDPVKPDRGTFNFLLATYAQVGDGQKAEALLCELLKQKPLPAQATAEQKKRSLYPNGVWYNLVLKALAASCDICDAVETKEWAGPRADGLLEQMKTLHGRGHSGLRPDTVTYNHVMNVHAHCGNTDRAKELILELEDAYEASGGDLDIIPDRITYTTVIKAYASQQEQVSSPQELLEIARNAEVVFQTMQELGDAGRPDISPSPITCTYSTC